MKEPHVSAALVFDFSEHLADVPCLTLPLFESALVCVHSLKLYLLSFNDGEQTATHSAEIHEDSEHQATASQP